MTVRTVKFPSVALLVVVLLIGLPLTASANAGTPLMWATMLHLAFGNAIIAMFEGFIIAKFFRLKSIALIWMMMAANYLSAWVGGFFLGWATGFLTLNLYNTWLWLWLMVGITFLITLVLEWPFVFFCFRKEKDRFKRSIQGNMLANGLSYILLFSWYWMASGTSLYTKMNVVHPSEIHFPKAGLIYFISETNTVCRFDFSSKKTVSICKFEVAGKDARLFVRRSAADTNNWDILESSKQNLVCSNLQVVAVPFRRDTNSPAGTWFNFGEAPKIGAADQSSWKFRTGFWSIEGLRGKNQKTGENIYFSLETPFVRWVVRNATHLPEDFIVFQLGENQICLFEVATKKIALLMRGRGPVVVLPK